MASYATGSVTAVGGIPVESRGIVVNGFGGLVGYTGDTGDHRQLCHRTSLGRSRR